jgi:beta-glucosidase
MAARDKRTVESRHNEMLNDTAACRISALALLAFASFNAAAAAEPSGENLPVYRDTSRPFDERAADLVARMTLEEKASQLVNDAAAVPRLGIREYNWWSEGLHGVAAAGYATVFPQAIGLAASFDVPRLKAVADVISIEFRAKYLAEQHRLGGSDWFAGLTVWSPNINIFRDPRWGRGQETYGEDPYLTSRLGVAFVKGLQGDDPTFLRAVSTPKHYAVHSGPEPSRHRDDIHPSQRDLVDTYLPAFRATVEEGGAGSVMCAYNAVDGVPACASNELLSHYLREAWNFDGYVVSDCGAVSDIYTASRHGYAGTSEQGVALAFEAGMDLICGDANEIEHIISAVKNGVLAEDVIDRALLRLLTARMRLGQFNDPADVFPTITASDYDTDEHRALALDTAEKALVLLKNEGGFLPLRQAPQHIAVIGPNADTVASLVGNYNGEPSRPVTVLDGIKRRFPGAEVTYAQGSGLIDPALAPVPSENLCTDARCRKPGLTAEVFADRSFEGAPTETLVSDEVRYAWEGERKNGAIRWSGYIRAPEDGNYTFRYDADGGYRIWLDSKMVVDAWNVDWRPSIATGKANLEAGKTYPIRIEAFQRRDHGNERFLWAVPSDQGAKHAVAAAKDADLVVFAAGLTSQVEGEEMHIDVDGFAGGDRTSLDLPAPQRKVLQQVAETGAPVVLVLINGSALSVNWADENLLAIIEAWYPGGQGGDAVAGAIAGDFSPAGRLPVTFYRSVDDLPPFSDYDMSHRTYRYFDGEVLYPFGYGLSYTSFDYRKARVSKKRVRANDNVDVTVDVINSGNRDGEEVVQLYVSRPGVEGVPIRALAGFERISLAVGETRSVSFTLDGRAMSIVGEDGVRRIPPGPVKLWIGGGQPVSREGLEPAAGLAASLEVTGSATLPD